MAPLSSALLHLAYDLEWLEHEIAHDFEHAKHFMGDVFGHLEHDVHEAHVALDVARAAVVTAGRGVVGARGKKSPATVALAPKTVTGLRLAARGPKPVGLELLTSPLRWSRSARLLVAGAASGAVSKTATAPLETLRIKLMTGTAGSSSSLGQVVSQMWTNGGPAAFFKGNGVNVARTIPSKSIQFAAFDTYKRLLSRKNATTGQLELPSWGSSVAGSLAGVTSTVLTHPLETLQTRLAAGSYSSASQALVSIFKKEGPKALFGGMVPSLVGIIPYSGINLGCYDGLRWAYTNKMGQAKVPKTAAFVMGALAGATAATVTYPLEVVRRRLMMGAKFTNTGVALVSIARAEGIGALYAGIGLNWLKVVPAGGLQIYSYEAFKEALQVS